MFLSVWSILQNKIKNKNQQRDAMWSEKNCWLITFPYVAIRTVLLKKIRCSKKLGMERSFFTMYAMFPGVQDDRKKFQSIFAVVQKFFAETDFMQSGGQAEKYIKCLPDRLSLSHTQRHYYCVHKWDRYADGHRYMDTACLFHSVSRASHYMLVHHKEPEEWKQDGYRQLKAELVTDHRGWSLLTCCSDQHPWQPSRTPSGLSIAPLHRGPGKIRSYYWWEDPRTKLCSRGLTYHTEPVVVWEWDDERKSGAGRGRWCAKTFPEPSRGHCYRLFLHYLICDWTENTRLHVTKESLYLLMWNSILRMNH